MPAETDENDASIDDSLDECDANSKEDPESSDVGKDSRENNFVDENLDDLDDKEQGVDTGASRTVDVQIMLQDQGDLQPNKEVKSGETSGEQLDSTDKNASQEVFDVDQGYGSAR